MSIPGLVIHHPTRLSDACALGRSLGADAAFLAGGTELLPDFHRDREAARHLIALDAVQGLRGVREEAGGLAIGALTTIREVATDRVVRDRFMALAEAARAIGSPAIRSLATIGGNFCRAVPCADTPPIAIAYGARLRLAGPEGEREIDAAQFFTGPRTTARMPGEVLVSVVLPWPAPRSGASYQRFGRRLGASLAVAAVAAALTFEGDRIGAVRIVLGAVAPQPVVVRAAAERLAGKRPSADLFADAAAACVEAARPIDDVRGTVEFRLTLVSVLARRALAAAAKRAGVAVA